jgi:serine/threonine protein kinase
MIGRTIGKYRFVEELGHGPLGKVYKAIDETLDREVAVKVLDPELSNSELMAQFQAEATTLARLHHADIAAIHEIQHTGTEILMVTEYVKGESLEHLSQRCGPLPAERAAYLVAQVLGALDHAHQAGVVHGDLTPASVTVTEQGRIKVMDFGVARAAAADQATSVGFALGPPSYLSPERLAGGDADGRADVYSAGVLLYKLLTGHVPFEAPTPLEMMQQQLWGVPAPLSNYRQDLPGWCQALVARALERNAADRFPTAESFRATLHAAIAESTEVTGLYSVVDGSSAASPDDLTAAAPIPPTVMAPVPAEDAPTVATWTPAPAAASAGPSSAAPSAPTATAPSGRSVAGATASSPFESVPPPSGRAPAPAAAAAGTTLVLKRNQFAVVGGLLLALVIGVIALAVVALRRPSTVIVAPAQQAVATPPAAGGAPAVTSGPAGGAPATGEPSGAASQSPPPLEIASPPLVVPSPSSPAPKPSAARPAPSDTPAPAEPSVSRAALITTPFRFDAHAVVADGDKWRERDAAILIADGTVTVSDKDKNSPLYVVPVDGVVGLTYSASRQPLWNSPGGPAEAMRVEGGAFGFLKGGRNWFGLQTKDSLLVLRVDDDAVGRVTVGLQERTGLQLQRLVEPKD